jgi:hypothetical protein
MVWRSMLSMASCSFFEVLQDYPTQFLAGKLLPSGIEAASTAAREVASIQMTAKLLDDLAQTFRVFFDDLARLL